MSSISKTARNLLELLTMRSLRQTQQLRFRILPLVSASRKSLTAHEQSDDDSRTRTISSEEIDNIVERKQVVFYLDKFDIDMSLCMYCGLCTEVCPTECLVMKDSLDGIAYSTFDRTSLIYHFTKLEMYGDTEGAEAEAAD